MAVAAPRFVQNRRPGDDEPTLRDRFAEDIRADIREREGNRLAFFPWAMRVPEPKAGILNFDAFPFQRELYKEGYDDREMVVKKATQIGISAWAVRWLIYHADLRGMTGLYIFPTLSDVYDFSDSRITPVIQASNYLRGRVLPDDPQNKGLKKIGLGFCYFRGSESKRKLDSVDADHIVFDEYDTLAQDNIPDAEMRLSGPLSKGLIRRIGVPSIPGWGIAKSYDESDQRKWMVKCGCGEWQTPTFFDNVDLEKAIIVCSACMKPLDVGTGQWVATYPDRDMRGYHITRLIAPTVNIASIIKQSKKRNPIERQVFFNKHLGEEFAPAEGRLSREALAAAQSAGEGYVQQPGYVGASLVTMGVDVASTRALNVRISKHSEDGSKIALFINEVEDFNELAKLMGRFQVNMAVIDHLPEGRLARAFAEKFAGRVYLCAYATQPTPTTPKVLNIDDEMRFVSVRRVEAMDATAEMIRMQDNKLPLDLPDGYIEAMQAPVRVATKDELGRVQVTYKSLGEDDYYHAETYDVVATACWQFRVARDEQDADLFTPLEEMLEFQRSDLSVEGSDDYSPGGRSDGEYYAGGR